MYNSMNLKYLKNLMRIYALNGILIITAGIPSLQASESVMTVTFGNVYADVFSHIYNGVSIRKSRARALYEQFSEQCPATVLFLGTTASDHGGRPWCGFPRQKASRKHDWP